MNNRWLAAGSLLTIGILLIAACGINPDAVGSGPVNLQVTIPVQVSSTTTSPPITTADLFDVVDDLQSWWSTELPRVFDGQTYEPLSTDRIVAGSADGSFPRCDRRPIDYEDVQGNAFAAPCSEGVTVVWDADELIPELDSSYGPVAAPIVLAHEWGHVAQFQSGFEGAPVVLEQQADCFAGAWLSHVIENPGKLASLLTANPLDSAVSSIIDFRDEPGTRLDVRGAHGSGFDRVRALQEGFNRGGEFCAAYQGASLPLIDLGPLQPTDDDPNATGNLPLDRLLPLVINDLNAFYNQFIGGFRGQSVEVILSSEETQVLLERLSDTIGDVAAGLVLGMIWADFAQQQAVGDEVLSGDDKVLQEACLTGGWLIDIVNNSETRDLGLTSGDFDEAILGLIDIASGDKAPNADGGLFDLVGSLRKGVVEGFDSCGLFG